AALGIERGDRDLDTVTPGTIDGCSIAGEAGRHTDLVVFGLGDTDKRRERHGRCADQEEAFLRHISPMVFHHSCWLKLHMTPVQSKMNSRKFGIPRPS